MVKKVMVALLLVAMTTGCLGRSALTESARKLNLSSVENKWGREGIYLGMNIFWVYRICTALDLLLFNSIEFWSGENPINHKSPLVDLPMEQVELMGLENIKDAQIERLSSTDAKLHLDFKNGDELTFDVTREGPDYTISYLGKEFYKGVLKEQN